MGARGRVDGLEGSFVGEVVAEISDGCDLGGLCEDLADGAAFVAAGAHFKAGLKFEQGDAFKLGEVFEEGAGAPLNLPGARGRKAAPVQDGGVGLFLVEPAEGVAAEVRAEFIEPCAGGGRGILKLAMAVGMQAFSAV